MKVQIESRLDRAPCAYGSYGAYVYQGSVGNVEQWKRRTFLCNVPYEDHDNETLGHEFVMPDPEEQDY